jgi:selenophosphate synthase
VGIQKSHVPAIITYPQILFSHLDFCQTFFKSPYILGRIALRITLSDLYAMGISNILEVFMLLGVSTDMSEKEEL